MQEQKRKILVVDDDPTISDLLVTLLSSKFDGAAAEPSEVDIIGFCKKEKPIGSMR